MYTEKQFEIKDLKGLSEKQISEHLKLYSGYVKNTNSLIEKIEKLKNIPDSDACVLAELKRRLGFEFNGMRLHEYYFEQLSGNGVVIEGTLKETLSSQYGNFENWLTDFKITGMMRGIGWTILYYDEENKKFFNVWVSDHDLGHLAGLKVILALDIWEHAFLLDYIPSQRKDYIEAFFSNLNWGVIEKRFNQ